MGALEGATAVPDDRDWQTETQRPKPAVPGTDQEPQTTGARGGYRSCEGNHSGTFFFEHSCDRPGCYEGFARQRRSPLQHYCSHACRCAMERVREREHHWKQARI